MHGLPRLVPPVLPQLTMYHKDGTEQDGHAFKKNGARVCKKIKSLIKPSHPTQVEKPSPAGPTMVRIGPPLTIPKQGPD